MNTKLVLLATGHIVVNNKQCCPKVKENLLPVNSCKGRDVQCKGDKGEELCCSA